MPEKIVQIRPPLIDNFTRIIKSLAFSGRTSYQQYLIHPLASWKGQQPLEGLDRLMDMLADAESHASPRLPLLYKMTIIKSVAPDQFNLAIPGNLSIDFLKSIKNLPYVNQSSEAVEFINLLSNPFRDYADREFNAINKKFETGITTADTIEVENLIEAHEGSERELAMKRELSAQAIAAISGLPRGDLNALKKAIIAYLVKFSDPAIPELHRDIHGIIERCNHDHPAFKKELYDSAAIVTYNEILKAIKDNKLDKAVKYIGKYTVLFRGNPETPNYKEVDTFERKFFKLIEDRNLWDKL